MLLSLCLSAVASGEEAPFVKKTYTFKTVDQVDVQLDLHRHQDDRVRPVLAYLHGGALIMGSRTGVPRQLLDLCQREGIALVSIDYRLAPEVKLPAIIEDVRDAFRWLRKEAGRLHLDVDRLVVSGGSAGGYLTMMCGIAIEPRPKALVAYWGYGDVDGAWYTEPSAFYRKQPLVKKEDAFAGVNKGILTGSDNPQLQGRRRFYLYLRQNGLWTKEVTGFDPEEREKLDPYCPVRNITRVYPPILMIHGTTDDDVPYELSAAMAKELERKNVPHELITVVGAGHGLAGGDPKMVEDAHKRAAAFILTHLRDEK
jgi:acetyl esterase/lipase